MRILLCLAHWDLIGGSERYAAVIARALSERGHAVGVLCAHAGAMGLSGVDVHAVVGLAEKRPSREARALATDFVERWRPDVILVLTAQHGDVFDDLLEQAPVVRFVQDHTLFCPGLNKVYEDGGLCDEPLGFACLRRYWLDGGCSGFKPVDGFRPWESAHRLGARLRDIDRHKGAARLVVASRYMHTELCRAGIDRERVAHIPYFTLSNSSAIPVSPLSTELERAISGELAIVFTPARLTLPDKGVDYLVTALGLVRCGFRAVVAGSGPAEAWLREKAREEGLEDRVLFTGWIGPGEIESLYARAAVVVCPSVWNEPFGLVGIEAMAHGKPVVAFAVGGIPEWLTDGENGFLVPRCDSRAMADAIDRLLADPALAREMGARGRDRVAREFAPATHVDAMERVLSEAARA